MPFIGGKQGFSCVEKQRKERKNKTTENKERIHKEGLGPSEVVGGCPKFPLFENLATKARTQKHYKNRGFSKAF